MTDKIEKTYNKLFKYAMFAINPFKKAIIQTECNVHKLINFQAIAILKNDRFLDAYNFFSDYIAQINKGVVWADQDLKSAGHFYNPDKKKGLYGNKDALSLAVEYYNNALKFWEDQQNDISMFYLGAAVHLVQDMTVPQHANNRLLDDHRKYENYVKTTCINMPEFAVHKGGYYLDSIEEVIRCNARNAIKIYSRLSGIKDDTKRFYAITKFTLPLAQKTTAGCFMEFYRDIGKTIKPNQVH